MYSHELGELAVETGIWPLYEVEEHALKMYGKSRHIARGKVKRKPVREYLMRQGRFAHFVDEDIEYFQAKVDEMWEKWLIPGSFRSPRRSHFRRLSRRAKRRQGHYPVSLFACVVSGGGVSYRAQA